MIQFEELRLSLLEYEEKLKQLREALGLDAMNKEIAELEEQTAQEGFWNDLENSQKVLQKTKGTIFYSTSIGNSIMEKKKEPSTKILTTMHGEL